ncbi:uncharacterized protein LOC106717625 [Papilio machaon]|uniref:uncharacterized protein LOC106717625 n=1 Tax=Papilio machaon TaxID=76193 RepID=UPI001E662AD8|nr:uncharacterized protein LOC106717625 [Papilio machaon]
MAIKGILPMTCHALVWALVVAFALWATGAGAEPARYDSATPHSPVYNKYKYAPPYSSYNSYEREDVSSASPDPEPSGYKIAPSELILSGLRTILDVVRNMNKKRIESKSLQTPVNSTAIQLRRAKTSNETESGRGFEEYYDEHHEHAEYHDMTTTAKPMKQGRYTDPWAGYYDWIINEGSFKFWSVFQLFTAALLLYACLSAIYYAKFNPIIPDYSLEYDDYFLERSVGRKARSVEPSELPSGLSWMNTQTFQFILDAIATHYGDQ